MQPQLTCVVVVKGEGRRGVLRKCELQPQDIDVVVVVVGRGGEEMAKAHYTGEGMDASAYLAGDGHGGGHVFLVKHLCDDEPRDGACHWGGGG